MADLHQEWERLTDPSDSKGAGLMRYASAMQLYRQNEISAEDLEQFRALSKQDNKLSPALESFIVRNLICAIEYHLDRVIPGQFKDVRNGVSRWRKGIVNLPAATQLDACRHIAPALSAIDDPLATAIRRAVPLLRWVAYDAYPRALIGEAFADGHAFASIIGETAPIHASDYDLGLFVVAPQTLYRDHRHAAPELYLPLTGPHRWRFNPGGPFIEKPAHIPVWNEPYAPHATLTGTTPFLCLFCWTRDVSAAASVIPADDWHLYE